MISAALLKLDQSLPASVHMCKPTIIHKGLIFQRLSRDTESLTQCGRVPTRRHHQQLKRDVPRNSSSMHGAFDRQNQPIPQGDGVLTLSFLERNNIDMLYGHQAFRSADGWCDQACHRDAS